MQRDIEKAFRRVGLEPKNINGKPAVVLGNFTITFYNYYFVVDGKIPLNVAEELYNEGIVGREDIRSGGDCGCRPPATWAIRYQGDKKAIDYTEGEKLRHMAKSSPMMADILTNQEYYLCASNEEFARLPAFVETYHIDSELGLYIFVQKLKQHQLIPT